MEQRVAILLYDSPEFAAAFFGAIKIGAVAVPLNTQLRVQDYLYMLNDSRAVALIVEEDLWAQLGATPRGTALPAPCAAGPSAARRMETPRSAAVTSSALLSRRRTP